MVFIDISQLLAFQAFLDGEDMLLSAREFSVLLKNKLAACEENVSRITIRNKGYLLEITDRQ